MDTAPAPQTMNPQSERATPAAWQVPARACESSPVHAGEEAAEYEAMARRWRRFLYGPYVDMLARIDWPAARVLDIGTGPGQAPVELALRKPDWDIWALDPSEDMLERGRRRAREAGVDGRVHFVKGSAEALPFAPGSFDIVGSHFALHHLDRPEQLFDEAARVVRGGGRVIIKDLRRQPRWAAEALLSFSRRVLGYTPAQLEMYRESLGAALTMAEARAAVRRSKLRLARVEGFRGLDFVVTG